MKKILVMVIVLMMMGVAANAFVVNVTGVDTLVGSTATVQLGDNTTSTGSWPGQTGDYVTTVGLKDGAYYTKILQKPAPEKFQVAVFRTAGFNGQSHLLSFWVQSLGNDGTFGANVAGKTWGVWGPSGALLDTFVTSATSTKVAPTWSKNIGQAPTTAAIYQFGLYTVPEPGSMVAMLSGLVGLVSFGIRRRK